LFLGHFHCFKRRKSRSSASRIEAGGGRPRTSVLASRRDSPPPPPRLLQSPKSTKSVPCPYRIPYAIADSHSLLSSIPHPEVISRENSLPFTGQNAHHPRESTPRLDRPRAKCLERLRSAMDQGSECQTPKNDSPSIHSIVAGFDHSWLTARVLMLLHSGAMAEPMWRGVRAFCKASMLGIKNGQASRPL
jgi:hypothetical protein